jgi:hypothetical protein
MQDWYDAIVEPTDESVAPKASPHVEAWESLLVPFRRELLAFLVGPGSNGRLREGDRTLSVWFAGDRWKACLRDKQGQCAAFFTGESLGELFFDLCLRLRKEACFWKQERPRKK